MFLICEPDHYALSLYKDLRSVYFVMHCCLTEPKKGKQAIINC